MAFTRLLAFAVAYLAAVALPGPGVAALVARILARGTHGAVPYIVGCAIGALAWFIVAVTGLAAVAATFGTFFAAIRYAGAAYLLYLAWRPWNAAAKPVAASDVEPAAEGAVRLFLTGLSVNLCNPKVVVFFLALLPTVVDVPALRIIDIAALSAVIVAAVVGMYAAYAVSAARARRLFDSPDAVRLANRGSSVVMAGAAAAIATR